MDRYELVSQVNGETYSEGRVATLTEAARVARVYLSEGAELVYAMELDADENIIPGIDAAAMWR